MKGARHSEEQIIAILKQGEAGLTTAELCRQQGITEQTYYRWKAKCGGMEAQRAEAAKAGRGREPTAQTHRGRANARHPGAHGPRSFVGPSEAAIFL